MSPGILSSNDPLLFSFFFNDTATTEIYTLSLHDALPISAATRVASSVPMLGPSLPAFWVAVRSEEHTSELQSQFHLVCRLLLEKQKRFWKHVVSAVESLPNMESASVSCGLPISGWDGQFFFFNDTATTEIYTLSLHDSLPI